MSLLYTVEVHRLADPDYYYEEGPNPTLARSYSFIKEEDADKALVEIRDMLLESGDLYLRGVFEEGMYTAYKVVLPIHTPKSAAEEFKGFKERGYYE